MLNGTSINQSIIYLNQAKAHKTEWTLLNSTVIPERYRIMIPLLIYGAGSGNE